jgi:Sel1 repeat
MKTILGILLICLLAQAGLSQTATPEKKHHKKGGATNDTANAQSGTPAPDPAAAQAAQVAYYQKSFIPTDPWRTINDKPTFAKGGDWVQFEGQVQRVTTDGIVLLGWYGEPLGYMLADFKPNSMTFNLSSYPRPVVIGQILSRNDRLVALKAGTKNDLPDLDYGTVYVPQLTEEQKTQVATAKTQADARVLAFHQELAAKGDAYGEYKMGVRYLNGDGVDKDVAKARDMLSKAAAQGNKDASDELAKIPPSN